MLTEINWKYCQNNSDFLLAIGLSLLTKQKKTSFDDNFKNEQGNYLISDNSNKWKYIGEAKSLSNRLKQHSRLQTSTFYKNYLNIQKDYINLPHGLKINDFQVCTVLTNIGRKEIEEFGIVNIPTNLNKFQLDKRVKYSGKTDQNIWIKVQTNFKSLLIQGEKELLKSMDYKWFDAEIKPNAGLYWVEHPIKGLIYIGESSNIFDRYETHSGTTYFSALRRHIGEDILGFRLQIRNGKKRYFKDTEDHKVTEFLSRCTIRPFAVNFGRFEIEEYLIRKHRPILNRKDNKE